MDIYGMYDRLLEHSGKALSWLERNSPTEAERELRLVCDADGKYVPRDLNPPTEKEPDPSLEATVITVVYPAGQHTFRRDETDRWTLSLVTPEGPGPDVTGYDDSNVLRVLGSFLGFHYEPGHVIADPARRVAMALRELTAGMQELALGLTNGVLLPIEEAVSLSHYVEGDPLPSEAVAAQEKIRAAAEAAGADEPMFERPDLDSDRREGLEPKPDDPPWMKPRHREVLHTLADGDWWTQVELTQQTPGPYGEVVRSARELSEHGLVEYSDSDGAPAYRIVPADGT